MTPARNDKEGSLAAAAMAGVAWTFGSQWVVRLIGLSSTVVLARALTPADFGVVATVMAVYAIVESLSDFQPQQYLVRAEAPDARLFDTAFTLAFIRGTLVSLLLAGLSFLLPALVGEPRLLPAALAVSLLPFLAGLENPRAVEFVREINFSFAASRQIATKLAGSAVAIAAALIWHSYWALVAGLLVRAALWLPVTYVIKPYRPRFSFANSGSFLGFSVWLALERIVNTLGIQADRLLVAGAVSIRAAGSFAIAKDFSWMVGGEFFAATDRVLFPALSRIGDDEKARRSGTLTIFSTLAAAALPWIIGAAFAGRELVLLLYGPQWQEVAGIITPLMLSLIFQPAATTARALALAAGRPHTLVLRNAAAVTMRLLLFYTGLRIYSLQGAIYLILPAVFVMALINLHIIRTIAGVSISSLFAASARSWISVTVMTAGLLAAAAYFPDGMNFWALAANISGKATLGAVLYIGCHILLWRLAGFPAGPERLFADMARKAWHRMKDARRTGTEAA